MGYQRNGYDWCVMKKLLMINNAPYSGMLTTRRCHILIPTLSLEFLEVLIQNTENLRNMTITRGKIHKYLGMIINNYFTCKNNIIYGLLN